MNTNKDSEGKPPYHLLPWDALEEVAKVLAMGAEKHGERAWETGIPYSESISALMRHQKLFFQDRKDYDVESGLLHTAHMACNILFLVAGQIRETADIDDRPGPITQIQIMESASTVDRKEQRTAELEEWTTKTPSLVNINDCRR